jgi:DNA polymerase III gamma/tau subunit
MSLLLRKICRDEYLDIKPTILREIIKVSNGCPRQALLLLEKISCIADENLSIAAIGEGLLSEAKTIELCRALLKKDWPTVAELLKGINLEPETVRYAVLGYFSAVLLGKGDDRTASIMATFTESFMYSGRAGLILACYLACQ